MPDSSTIESIEAVVAASHNNDKAVTNRLIDILHTCTDRELTVDELCDKYEMHYQTIYANVKFLQSLGLLQVSPKKQNRKYKYFTNWTLIGQQDSELKWRDYQGNFVPVSEYIEKFHKVAPELLSSHTVRFAQAMISYKENGRRLAQDQPNYGIEHQAACRRRMQNSITFIENLLSVMHQAVDSPAFTKDDGWEMYKLPDYVDEELASSTHDEMEMVFQELGWYEGK